MTGLTLFAKFRKTGFLSLLLLSVLFLSACSTSKPIAHEQHPSFPLPDAYESNGQNNATKQNKAQSAEQYAREQIQFTGGITLADDLATVFTDPVIDAIIATVSRDNFNLAASRNQLQAAGYSLTQTQAILFPQLDLNVSASRSKTASAQLAGATSNTFNLSLDAGWEIDVWGKLSDQVMQSELSVLQLTENVTSTRQSLIAQAIENYFAIIGQGRIMAVYRSQHQAYQTIERSIRERFLSGLSNAEDLALAQTATLSAEQALIASENQQRNLIRQLNTLLGDYPSLALNLAETTLAKQSQYPALKRPLKLDVPSTTLMRRPDIQAAYYAVAVADTAARIAYKDLFPSFALSASTGESSNVLREWIKSPLDFWKIAGALVTPVFDAGRRQAEVERQKALAEQAFNQYQQTVLNAFLEVEQTLDASSSLTSQQQLVTRALQSAKAAQTRTSENYQNGLDTIFALMDAKQYYYNLALQLENLNQQRAQNQIQLALSLGRI